MCNLFTKELHIKNKTLGLEFGSDCNHIYGLYVFRLYRKSHARGIGQDTRETYFTIGILHYTKRIKVITHKRTHIKQRIV